ncbi:MAG TPA: ABC transporter permease [Opitutaceae bacterium]
MIRLIGAHSLARIEGLGQLALFTTRALGAVHRGRGLGERLVRSIHSLGVRCLSVISIVGLFTGLVLGLQGFHVLGRFGSESLLGTLVSLTLIRELAPVLAALMIVGQAGSALAAELGIQRNSEQIDALEIMGVDALAYLVTPRLLAAIVVFPILTMLFSVVGLVGGYVSSSAFLGLDGGVYWAAVNSSVQGGDLFEAAIKALVFGLTTVAICAYQGYHAHSHAGEKGARAVSAATTRAVVQASVAVLAADYAVTSFLV